MHTPDDLDAALLQQIGQERTGQSVELTEAAFKQALDPRAFVEARTVTGGAAPAATSAVLDDITDRLNDDTAWLDAEQTRLESAEDVLKTSVQNIIDGVTTT